MTAVVTGASSGLGAATARRLASQGVRVALGGTNCEALGRVAKEIGGLAVPGDLRDPACAPRTISTVSRAFGGLDIVVANAGIGWAGPFSAMGGDDIDALLDVNLRSTAHLIRAALDHLQPGRGRIALVGSIAGLVGVPGEAWYSATKAGVGCLAEALRQELSADGIGVTLVSPGAVKTDYFIRRKQGYDRRHPRPLDPDIVAAEIVAGIERRTHDVIVPLWLTLPVGLKFTFPNLYRILSARFS